MNEKYFKMLIKLSKKAYDEDEVPVSALIVYNNKVIAKSYNTRKKDNNPLNHAEIKCIIKAGKKLNDWRLQDCELYTSLEPCNMCKSIIQESRIKKTYYLINSDKEINNKSEFINVNNSYSDEYRDLLKNFFNKLRK